MKYYSCLGGESSAVLLPRRLYLKIEESNLNTLAKRIDRSLT